jgi:hypothetical protein
MHQDDLNFLAGDASATQKKNRPNNTFLRFNVAIGNGAETTRTAKLLERYQKKKNNGGMYLQKIFCKRKAMKA